MSKFTILGSGLAGLSSSYHLGHNQCTLYEMNTRAFGHIYSEKKNGFTWDEGPHVSFTKHDYVKELFSASVEEEYLEHNVQPINYFYGHWVPHPAQTNLFAIPEPTRSECLEGFLNSRSAKEEAKPSNYKEWLDAAFGKVFTSKFPSTYTEKYWTVRPELLSTQWIGDRVFSPDVAKVKSGYLSKPEHSDHYITKVRYPAKGGYMEFAKQLFKGADIRYQHELTEVDFKEKKLKFSNGNEAFYENLISTIPLPVLVKLARPPAEVKQAADMLVCSELLLVNVEISHAAKRTEHWFYVYDKEKYATRVNYTELLSPENAPSGKSGMQVEVYFSKYRKQVETDNEIANKVVLELIEMGLIESHDKVDNIHTKKVKYANVLYDLNYRANLDCVLSWLEQYGLVRESDDLEPMTNWSVKENEKVKLGSLILAGRFGQWKYFWTDDCVLRGKLIASLNDC